MIVNRRKKFLFIAGFPPLEIYSKKITKI